MYNLLSMSIVSVMRILFIGRDSCPSTKFGVANHDTFLCLQGVLEDENDEPHKAHRHDLTLE